MYKYYLYKKHSFSLFLLFLHGYRLADVRVQCCLYRAVYSPSKSLEKCKYFIEKAIWTLLTLLRVKTVPT